MKAKKARRDEHGPRHVTPAGRSVFHDLFPKAEADELVMRSETGGECGADTRRSRGQGN
jgi:hypothetical protein